MTALFRKDDRRILALWLPHLATDRLIRRRFGRLWRSSPQGSGSAERLPLVIGHRERNALRIAALDEKAEALGLKPGMGIADARAMQPDIDVLEADPQADRRLLEGLADWCDRYTPLVACDGTDGLFLDITGCAHLFGGEKAMLNDVLACFFHQGIDARGGLACTPGAAWAAARFGVESIPPGREAESLAPLPLAALRLESETRAGLESVGLATVGPVIESPRAPLARRFGATLLMRLDQALGRVEEAISPHLAVAPLSVERRLGEPVVASGDIDRLVAMLAATLKTDLERRGEGARRLELALFRMDGAVRRLAVGTARPLRDPALVRQLFRERMAALDDALEAGCGFDLVRLSVRAAAPLPDSQVDFAGEDPQRTGSLPLLAERVAARLGPEALMRPCFVESHVPERSAVHRPFGEDGWPAGLQDNAKRDRDASFQASDAMRRPRPIRILRTPEPVEVTATVPDGPPVRFRWRRALHDVARAEGPERIAPEWWLEEAAAETRDYFRVEDAAGRRYWLYREGLYGTSPRTPRWFMHGLFA